MYEHDRRASIEHKRDFYLGHPSASPGQRPLTPPPAQLQSDFSRKSHDFHEPLPSGHHPVIINTVYDILHQVAVSSGHDIQREEIHKYLQLPLSKMYKWSIVRDKEANEEDQNEYFRLTCLVEGLWHWYKPGDVEKLEQAMREGKVQLTVECAEG